MDASIGAEFIEVQAKYHDKKALANVIYYIAGESESKKRKTHHTGVRGCRTKSTKEVIEKMWKIIKPTMKNKKSRSLYHWVVTLPELCLEDAAVAKLIAEEIADYFWELGYQIYFGVHEDTEILHIHIAQSSCNYLSRKKFHINKKELEQHKKKIRGIIRQALVG